MQVEHTIGGMTMEHGLCNVHLEETGLLHGLCQALSAWACAILHQAQQALIKRCQSQSYQPSSGLAS